MSSNIRVHRICGHCGSLFEAKTTVTKFCSHKCSSKAHKLRTKQLKVSLSDQETREKVQQPIIELNAKEFLSIDETCTLLGVSRMTLYRQLQRRKVAASRIGRRVILSRATINQLLK